MTDFCRNNQCCTKVGMIQTQIFIFLRNQPIYSRYKWAFVPEVDTESSPVTSQLVENHQECQPHIVRIMDLLKMKYGVKKLFLFFLSFNPLIYFSKHKIFSY